MDNDVPTSEAELVSRIAELEEEVETLRALVLKLRTQHADLLKTAIDRDYERPPHYL